MNKNKNNDINNNALLVFHKKWLFYAIDTNYKIKGRTLKGNIYLFT